jgi:hypothetical protein
MYTKGITKVFQTQRFTGTTLVAVGNLAAEAGYTALAFNGTIHILDCLTGRWVQTPFVLSDFTDAEDEVL